ncbi:MAG: hypothetical protein ACXWEV_02710 [Methylobacter sp.]
MNKLKVSLANCYGIQSLDEEFDFASNPAKPKAKAYAIYAPNGLMKRPPSQGLLKLLPRGMCQKKSATTEPQHMWLNLMVTPSQTRQSMSSNRKLTLALTVKKR